MIGQTHVRVRRGSGRLPRTWPGLDLGEPCEPVSIGFRPHAQMRPSRPLRPAVATDAAIALQITDTRGAASLLASEVFFSTNRTTIVRSGLWVINTAARHRNRSRRRGRHSAVGGMSQRASPASPHLNRTRPVRAFAAGSLLHAQQAAIVLSTHRHLFQLLDDLDTRFLHGSEISCSLLPAAGPQVF